MRAEIPDYLEYQLSENKEQFLLFDSGHGDDDRIFTFATDQAVKLLANSGDWGCDRAFSACSQIFFPTVYRSC